MTQSNSSADAFNDSLNFVKKLWGQMSVPGMSMPSTPGMTIPGLPNMPLPSMSLEDLDKRIQELKTVETWLNVNMTMLRNTIQALEVQRATIATLHSLSSTMANTMRGGLSAGESLNPFAAHSSPAADSAPPSKPESEPVAAAESTSKAKSKSAKTGAADEEASPLIAQSAVWWQNVQDQFKHALGTALEKSTANYEAAKTASETFAKAGAASVKTAPRAAASSAATKTTSKTAPRAAPKSAAKAKTKAKAPTRRPKSS